MSQKPFTVASFIAAKRNNQKISMLTAYDYTTAKLLDKAGVDTLLVGDSLGMTMLGYENTLQVTMEDMLHHTRAVVRGVTSAFVIADMPFLSYHTDTKEAVVNAGRFIQHAGAQAVKLERGVEIIDKVKAIIDAQIPVIGHLGLTPQSVNMFGGFKIQGRDESQIDKIMTDALALEAAGAFAIVLECIPEKLAKAISERLSIPTIGIGAGKYCDGQVLVIQDLLGMYSDISPKFVKQYATLGEEIIRATQSYIGEVQRSEFPDASHTYDISQELIDKIQD